MSPLTGHHDALTRLGTAAADSVASVLETFLPGEISRGEVSVLPDGINPFGTVASGTVAAGVSYVDGITGANVFLVPVATARALASRMGAGTDETGDDPLSELELSAVSEASNQMMATTAGAIGAVLGQEIEISPPVCRQVDGEPDVETMFGSAPYAVGTTFLLDEHPCRLIQLVPSTFVARVEHALDDLLGAAEISEADELSDRPAVNLRHALDTIHFRVWAEIGRKQIPLDDTLKMSLGGIIEFDQAVDDPVDIYVNGLRFAHGRLINDEQGHWAVQVDEVVHAGDDAADPEPHTFIRGGA